VNQSDLVRDLTDPGWREREKEREQKFLAAIPLRTCEGVRVRVTDAPFEGDFVFKDGSWRPCGYR